MSLKDYKFTNGTIEFDIFLKEEQCFPGVYFRAKGRDGEQWFVRPHLSGKPDANQAAPVTNGITPWQLYFGEKYSFPYAYKFDDWTHVKIVVNNDKAQVYLDYSEAPNLSWNQYLPTQDGEIIFRGGNASGIHIANVKIDNNNYKLNNFKALERQPIEELVQEWEVSDKFEENSLDDLSELDKLIKARKWVAKIQVEEGVAANISRKMVLRDGTKNNTVFAKIEIVSDKAQTKLFQFGYSDRVVAILNGKPIYGGTNKWRSRDYRYLGTVGLFDAVYLNLNKGKNTLIMAVSEDFGGWLITGKFKNKNGITIKQ
ncbi:hypothetical protein [Winogradskyella sp. PG-2]|uniref:hypothetical protein n=1 Tax=Winogradskyella sp. PG-2 TaxID=754409 RepID=UPI0004588B12|nr:hypothetical protein [Winogradskyella sp. PG-2]BAO77398.1 hypothetical protein WPG_3168 [Winogradskyella sp. PG-2]